MGTARVISGERGWEPFVPAASIGASIHCPACAVHPSLSSMAERVTRAFIASRTTSHLLAMWEVADCQRDDAAREVDDLTFLAAARLIDWIIDELDARQPTVLVRWHALEDAGHHHAVRSMFVGDAK